MLLIILIISNFQYNKLQRELNKLKIEKIELIDSLVYMNNELEKQISDYNIKTISLEETIDSLQHVKNKIIVKRDGVVVSKSTADGVKLLQENLSK